MSTDLSLEQELSSLLGDDPPRPAVGAPGRSRLLDSITWLERFAPHASLVAEALAVDLQQARRSFHALSDRGGWVLVPVLPDLKIRPVLVGPANNPREIAGAVFAQVAPGGCIPHHLHHGPEVMVVLQGFLGDTARPSQAPIPAGGVLRSADGTQHELRVPTAPDIACVCLVVNQGWAEYL